jgi:hypothetical protein
MNPVLGRFISVDPAKQELNWYAYCGNNPVKYVDPDGEFFDAIFDAIGIAWDIVEIAANPSNPISWVSLAADVGCLFIPGATGAGSAIKAADKAANIGKAIKTADKTKDVVELVEKGNRIVGTYNNIRKVVKGTALQVHHIIEQRFSKLFGEKVGHMLSVALTKEQHQIFTNRWRQVIGYGKDYLSLTKKELLNAVQKVYYDAPELLEIAKDVVNRSKLK